MPTFHSIGLHPDLIGRLVTESSTTPTTTTTTTEPSYLLEHQHQHQQQQQQNEKQYQIIETPYALLSRDPSTLRIVNRRYKTTTSTTNQEQDNVKENGIVNQLNILPQYLVEQLRYDVAKKLIEQSFHGKRLQQHIRTSSTHNNNNNNNFVHDASQPTTTTVTNKNNCSSKKRQRTTTITTNTSTWNHTDKLQLEQEHDDEDDDNNDDQSEKDPIRFERQEDVHSSMKFHGFHSLHNLLQLEKQKQQQNQNQNQMIKKLIIPIGTTTTKTTTAINNKVPYNDNNNNNSRFSSTLDGYTLNNNTHDPYHPTFLSTHCTPLDHLLSGPMLTGCHYTTTTGVATSGHDNNDNTNNRGGTCAGGIPFGYVTQLSGPPGTGKTQFALQMAATTTTTITTRNGCCGENADSGSAGDGGLYQTWYFTSSSALPMYVERLTELTQSHDDESSHRNNNDLFIGTTPTKAPTGTRQQHKQKQGWTETVLKRTIFATVVDAYQLLTQLARLESNLLQNHVEIEDKVENNTRIFSGCWKPILLVIDSCSGCLFNSSAVSSSSSSVSSSSNSNNQQQYMTTLRLVALKIKRLTRFYGVATFLINGTVRQNGLKDDPVFISSSSTLLRNVVDDDPNTTTDVNRDMESRSNHTISNNNNTIGNIFSKPALGRWWQQNVADIHLWVEKGMVPTTTTVQYGVPQPPPHNVYRVTVTQHIVPHKKKYIASSQQHEEEEERFVVPTNHSMDDNNNIHQQQNQDNAFFQITSRGIENVVVMEKSSNLLEF